jgi:Response regulator containing CheY-like receiver domain and AraC-type DNA-binding domain
MKKFQGVIGLNILIVDDSKDFTYVLREYLKLFKDLDCELSDIANDGIDALERINENHPDIIILDIVMPNMDGIEVIRHIKSMQFPQKPQVIILTAFPNTEFADELLSLGVDNIIAKPFDIEILVSRIRKVAMHA